MYQKVVNMYEWEGTAGKPAVKGNNGAIITLENLADFDVRQTDWRSPTSSSTRRMPSRSS